MLTHPTRRFWTILALVGFLGIAYAGMRGIILTRFAAQERNDVGEDVDRGRALITAELQNMETTAGDYAGWDDTCDFVKTGNPAYVKANLNPAAIRKLRLDLMALADTNGRIRHISLIDFRTGADRPIKRSLLRHLAPGSRLFAHTSPESSITGFIHLPEGLMMIASRPILTSDFKGPVKGSLLVGRFLDETETRRLAGIAKLNITVRQGYVLSPPHTTPRPSPGDPVEIRLPGDGTIVCSALLTDVYGKPAGALQISKQRVIYTEGSKAVNTFFILTAIITTALTLLLTHYMTGREHAEERLRLLNDQLEERVAGRTEELQQLNGELESFCYSISHELRAPIARLEGFSSMIADCAAGGSQEQLPHFCERLGEACSRLRSVVDSLLQMNRLMRVEVGDSPIDLSRMAQQITRDLLEGADGRNIQLKIAHDIVVRGDRHMLGVCLQNLLGNAVKYTERTAEAVIEFGRINGQGGSIYFVRDNGAGFDMAYRDKLFMPFSRLHNETEFKGNGIGLATVQRIITRHGGRIWAEAEPGKGATFYFTIGE